MIREHLVLPSAHYPFQHSAVLPDEFNTNRLCARRLTHAHLPFIIAMHEDTALMASMGGTRDAAASRAYVDGGVRHWADHGYGMFVLHDIATGVPIGRAGFKHVDSNDRTLVEIAYALRPNAWGKGLAQEVARALAALAFERLPVNGLTAITLQTNTASQRVLEMMGMTCVGVTHDTPEPKVRYEMYRAD
jgi:RimJ/RimL family protein N-acetyltransferase